MEAKRKLIYKNVSLYERKTVRSKENKEKGTNKKEVYTRSNSKILNDDISKSNFIFNIESQAKDTKQMIGSSNTNELANSSINWSEKLTDELINDIQKERKQIDVTEYDDIWNLHTKKDKDVTNKDITNKDITKKLENNLRIIIDNPNFGNEVQNYQGNFYLFDNLKQISKESKKWKYFFLVISKSYEILKNQNLQLKKETNEISNQIHKLNLAIEEKNIKLDILEKDNKRLKNNMNNMDSNLLIKKNKELELQNKILNEVKLLNEKAIRILSEQLKNEKQKSIKEITNNPRTDISEEKYMQLSHQHVEACSNLIEEVICLRSDLEKENIKSIKNSLNFNSIYSKNNLISPKSESKCKRNVKSKLSSPKEEYKFSSFAMKTQILNKVKKFNPYSRKISIEPMDSDKLLRLNRSSENTSRPKKPYLFSVNHKKQRSVQLL